MALSPFYRVVFFLAAILSAGLRSDANTQIKIVEAPAMSRISPLPSTSKVLTLRVKPANESGPSHLQQLAGQCFKLSERGYKYEVCPFHNVTQKEERMGWNSFHGVLGVWREWIIENDTFKGMYFGMGERCSLGDREVKVLFNCSTVTRLHNATEPKTCRYHIWMDTPLACFKGAMQVYHVLTPEQLTEWDELDYQYHAEELTFQGLSKKRRKLLTKAGLLFDFERERLLLAEEERKKKEAEEQERKKREEQLNSVVNPFFKSPLTTCEEERDKLRAELNELKEKVHEVVREFPAVAFKLGFIQNDSHAEPAAHVAMGHTETVGEEGGVVAVDMGRVIAEEHGDGVEERGLPGFVDGGERAGEGKEGRRRDEEEEREREEGDMEIDELLKEVNDEVDEGGRRNEMEELENDIINGMDMDSQEIDKELQELVEGMKMANQKEEHL